MAWFLLQELKKLLGQDRVQPPTVAYPYSDKVQGCCHHPPPSVMHTQHLCSLVGTAHLSGFWSVAGSQARIQRPGDFRLPGWRSTEGL